MTFVPSTDRASPCPTGTAQARGREIFRGRQERDLLAWARESHGLIGPERYLPYLEDRGEEHRVWLDWGAPRYFLRADAALQQAFAPYLR